MPLAGPAKACHETNTPHATELVQEVDREVGESRGLGEAGRCEGREAREKRRGERKLGTRRGRSKGNELAWRALLKGAHAVERDLVTGDDVTALAEIGRGNAAKQAS